VPHVADLLTKQIKGALTQALGPGNWDAAFVEKLGHQQGVHFGGYEILAGGSIIVGLLWGSIAAFLVDGALGRALRFSILALALAACGVIHSSSLGWTFSSVTAGYGVLVVMLGLAAAGRLKQE
jgi:AGZA family xanthine/uracil permease-like MFS transporter